MRLAPQRQRATRGPPANGVHIHHNDFYDNANGFTTDVFTAAGHPGFPQDSRPDREQQLLLEQLQPLREGLGRRADACRCRSAPACGSPGGNNNIVRNNHFWDNWRRGAMLFAVPDSTVCGPAAGGNEQAGMRRRPSSPRPTATGTTATRWGATPSGKRRSQRHRLLVGQLRRTTPTTAGTRTPARPAPAASITSEPSNLPSNCATSRGLGGPAQEAELGACLADFDYAHTGSCPWFTTPQEPKP